MKNLNKIGLLLITISLFSCGEPLKEGEIAKVSKNDSIDVFEYCYDENRHNIIIARFKNKNVNTVNQIVQSGKTTYNQATVIIENDSIIVLRK